MGYQQNIFLKILEKDNKPNIKIAVASHTYSKGFRVT